MVSIEHVATAVLGAVSALTAWNISRTQERQKARQFDLEYVRSIVDEQLKDMRSERDRAHAELVRLHERIAVLEAQLQEMEKARDIAIARLNHENEQLRKINRQLAAEIRQLREAIDRPS